MTRTKRAIAALAAAALVVPLSPVTPASANHIDVRSIESACPVDEVVTGVFADLAGSQFDRAAHCLADYGITNGLGPVTFGAAGMVTREQLAVFVYRIALLAGADLDTRDAGLSDLALLTIDEADDAVNALVRAGVLSGFADGTFRPGEAVRRDAMAKFLSGALAAFGSTVDARGVDYFDDDADNTFETWINEIAAAGITAGTGADRTYEPDLAVRRDTMAAFLARVLDVLVEEGAITSAYAPPAFDELTVGPSEAQTLTVTTGADDDPADDRTYTVAGAVPAVAYRVTLVDLDLFDLGFTDSDDDGLAETGDPVADLELVAGAAPRDDDGPGTPDRASDGSTATVVAPEGGTFTFVVDADAPGGVLAVVHRNGGPGLGAHEGGDSPRLEVDEAGQPVEAYGVGGPTTWVEPLDTRPAAAVSAVASDADGEDQIAVVFDEPIQGTGSYAVVRTADLGTLNGRPSSNTAVVGGQGSEALVLSSNVDLSEGSDYSLVVTGEQDAAGNATTVSLPIMVTGTEPFALEGPATLTAASAADSLGGGDDLQVVFDEPVEGVGTYELQDGDGQPVGTATPRVLSGSGLSDLVLLTSDVEVDESSALTVVVTGERDAVGNLSDDAIELDATGTEVPTLEGSPAVVTAVGGDADGDDEIVVVFNEVVQGVGSYELYRFVDLLSSPSPTPVGSGDVVPGEPSVTVVLRTDVDLAAGSGLVLVVTDERDLVGRSGGGDGALLDDTWTEPEQTEGRAQVVEVTAVDAPGGDVLEVLWDEQVGSSGTYDVYEGEQLLGTGTVRTPTGEDVTPTVVLDTDVDLTASGSYVLVATDVPDGVGNLSGGTTAIGVEGTEADAAEGPPTVLSATGNDLPGNDSITVVFNEPVVGVDAYNLAQPGVGGAPVFTDTTIVSGLGTETLVLQTAVDLVDGETSTLSFTAERDLAGKPNDGELYVTLTSLEAAAVEGAATLVSVTAADAPGDDELTVVFSEPVNGGSYVLVRGDEQVGTATVVETAGDTVTLTTAVDVVDGTDHVLVATGQTDASGNRTDDSADVSDTGAEVVAAEGRPRVDETALASELSGPALGSVSTGDVVTLRFSEAVGVSPSTQVALRDEDGDTVLVRCGQESGVVANDDRTTAACTLDGQVLRLVLLEDADDTNTNPVVGDGALTYPLELMAVTGVTDVLGRTVDLAASDDRVVETGEPPVVVESIDAGDPSDIDKVAFSPDVEDPTLDDRRYRATGLVPGQEYRITLLLQTSVLGEGAFAATDGLLDTGSPTARLTTVNRLPAADNTGDGTPLVRPEVPTSTAVGFADEAGFLEYTVDGEQTEQVLPVVHRNGAPGSPLADGGSSPRLELDSAGRPVEPYALGGVTRFQGPAQVVSVTAVDVEGDRDELVVRFDEAVTLTGSSIYESGTGSTPLVDASEGPTDELRLRTVLDLVDGQTYEVSVAVTDASGNATSGALPVPVDGLEVEAVEGGPQMVSVVATDQPGQDLITVVWDEPVRLTGNYVVNDFRNEQAYPLTPIAGEEPGVVLLRSSVDLVAGEDLGLGVPGERDLLGNETELSELPVDVARTELVDDEGPALVAVQPTGLDVLDGPDRIEIVFDEPVAGSGDYTVLLDGQPSEATVVAPVEGLSDTVLLQTGVDLDSLAGLDATLVLEGERDAVGNLTGGANTVDLARTEAADVEGAPQVVSAFATDRVGQTDLITVVFDEPIAQQGSYALRSDPDNRNRGAGNPQEPVEGQPDTHVVLTTSLDFDELSTDVFRVRFDGVKDEVGNDRNGGVVFPVVTGTEAAAIEGAPALVTAVASDAEGGDTITVVWDEPVEGAGTYRVLEDSADLGLASVVSTDGDTVVLSTSLDLDAGHGYTVSVLDERDLVQNSTGTELPVEVSVDSGTTEPAAIEGPAQVLEALATDQPGGDLVTVVFDEAVGDGGSYVVRRVSDDEDMGTATPASRELQPANRVPLTTDVDLDALGTDEYRIVFTGVPDLVGVEASGSTAINEVGTEATQIEGPPTLLSAVAEDRPDGPDAVRVRFSEPVRASGFYELRVDDGDPALLVFESPGPEDLDTEVVLLTEVDADGSSSDVLRLRAVDVADRVGRASSTDVDVSTADTQASAIEGAPQVLSVRAVDVPDGLDQVVVTWSEPVRGQGTYTVGGEPALVVSPESSAPSSDVVLETEVDLDGAVAETYEVTVVSERDAVGTEAAEDTWYVVAEGTEAEGVEGAPTVVSALGYDFQDQPDRVLVTFSEPVQNVGAYLLVQTTDSVPTAVVVLSQPEPNVLVIGAAVDLVAGSGVDLQVVEERDALGNATDDPTVVGVDVTDTDPSDVEGPPRVLSVTAVDVPGEPDRIAVQYSQPVSGSGTYGLLDAGGQLVADLTILSPTGLEPGTTVLLQTEVDLSTGGTAYRLSSESERDMQGDSYDVADVRPVTRTGTETEGLEGPPLMMEAVGVDVVDGPDRVEVTWTEAVAGLGAYTLVVLDEQGELLDSPTTATYVSGAGSSTLVLDSGLDLAAGARLRLEASGEQDPAGNSPVEPQAVGVGLDGTEVVELEGPAGLVSVTAVDHPGSPDEIHVVFDEPVRGAGGYVLLDADRDPVGTVTVLSPLDGTSATVVLQTEVDLDAGQPATYSLQVLDEEDAARQQTLDEAAVVLTGAEAEGVEGAPQVVSAQGIDFQRVVPDRLEVVFSEPVQAGGTYILFQTVLVDGEPQTGYTEAGVVSGAGTTTLLLGTDVDFVEGSVFRLQISGVPDLSGKSPAEPLSIDVDVTGTDVRESEGPPAVVSVTSLDVADGPDQVVVRFDEPVRADGNYELRDGEGQLLELVGLWVVSPAVGDLSSTVVLQTPVDLSAGGAAYQLRTEGEVDGQDDVQTGFDLRVVDRAGTEAEAVEGGPDLLTVTGVDADGDDQIRLTFDEPVAEGSFWVEDVFSQMPVAITNVGGLSTTTVVLTVEGDITPSSTLRVIATDVQDQGGRTSEANRVALVDSTEPAASEGGPVVISVVASDVVGDDRVTVTFDRVVQGVGTYDLVAVVGTGELLPAEVLSGGGSDTLVLQVSLDLDSDDSYDLLYRDEVDADDDLSDYLSFRVNVAGTEPAALEGGPVLLSATAADTDGADRVTLVFSEPVWSGSFGITNLAGAPAYAVTGVQGSATDTLVLTVSVDITAASNLRADVTGATDVNGDTTASQSLAVVVTGTEAAASEAPVAIEAVIIEVPGDDRVAVLFDEPVRGVGTYALQSGSSTSPVTVVSGSGTTDLVLQTELDLVEGTEYDLLIDGELDLGGRGSAGQSIALPNTGEADLLEAPYFVSASATAGSGTATVVYSEAVECGYVGSTQYEVLVDGSPSAVDASCSGNSAQVLLELRGGATFSTSDTYEVRLRAGAFLPAAADGDEQRQGDAVAIAINVPVGPTMTSAYGEDVPGNDQVIAVFDEPVQGVGTYSLQVIFGTDTVPVTVLSGQGTSTLRLQAATDLDDLDSYDLMVTGELDLGGTAGPGQGLTLGVTGLLTSAEEAGPLPGPPAFASAVFQEGTQLATVTMTEPLDCASLGSTDWQVTVTNFGNVVPVDVTCREGGTVIDIVQTLSSFFFAEYTYVLSLAPGAVVQDLSGDEQSASDSILMGPGDPT